MTQYDEIVENQRLLLEAEEWAKIPKSVHIHRLDSMWYETEDSKKFLDKGNVTDIQYNNGIIKRQQDGKTVHTFGEEITGEELIRAYVRGGQ
tara:strand:+ start:754 stop:1029 length:276 start_codon:yes stop_codon:yes gene_type:complete